MGYIRPNMRVLHPTRRFQLSWASVLGIVCVALVLMIGVIQVTHAHPIGQVDHEGCSLCLTAHNAVQAVALVILAISIRPVTRVAVRVRREVPRQRFLLKLANRPPPALSVSA
jgi:hypothetical protein